MAYKHLKGNEIEGHLDIFFYKGKDESDGDDVLIHGDPKGLRSLAKLLMEIADLNQEVVDDTLLPIGAREHYSLRPNLELSKSSVTTLVGRLDAKGTGEFYDRFIAKDRR
ncbi:MULTISPECIES: hypothetical protein [unclassified Flavobacterium]|uniref:Imm32 family immunity protein n=1 Tax=unclassified Flavobacterium TaxID=196869 RepID=UPI001F12975E|nr:MULTISPECIES: hypothetical protein [unclassified Flavobacterium]UMY64550.1 hypothetical protein MKO97_08500 [Flavobacterium sp. HJ-32-4]